MFETPLSLYETATLSIFTDVVLFDKVISVLNWSNAHESGIVYPKFSLNPYDASDTK